jgi:hypothetical protein
MIIFGLPEGEAALVDVEEDWIKKKPGNINQKKMDRNAFWAECGME